MLLPYILIFNFAMLMLLPLYNNFKLADVNANMAVGCQVYGFIMADVIAIFIFLADVNANSVIRCYSHIGKSSQCMPMAIGFDLI